jgi:hypothetical protein
VPGLEPVTVDIANAAVAALAFADGADWWGPALVDWVAAFEPLADTTTVEVAADVSLDHLRMSLHATGAVVAARAAPWFTHLGLEPPRPLPTGLAVGAAACWLDLGADLRSGMSHALSPGSTTADVFTALPDTASVRRIAEWADADNVSAVESIGAPAGDDRSCEVTVELAGPTIDEQLAAGLGLFDALGVAWPPDDHIGLLAAAGRPRLRARVATLGDGVAEIGLGSVEPTTDLVLRLGDAYDGVDDRSLAAFEGALGVTGRARAEIVQAPAPAARITYRLR